MNLGIEDNIRYDGNDGISTYKEENAIGLLTTNKEEGTKLHRHHQHR